MKEKDLFLLASNNPELEVKNKRMKLHKRDLSPVIEQIDDRFEGNLIVKITRYFQDQSEECLSSFKTRSNSMKTAFNCVKLNIKLIKGMFWDDFEHNKNGL